MQSFVIFWKFSLIYLASTGAASAKASRKKVFKERASGGVALLGIRVPNLKGLLGVAGQKKL